MAIIDINGFKPINDEHGHLAGDEVLKQFAAELQSACRSADLIGRWGGDEFIILLDCDLTKARLKIDRLREWVCGSYKIQGRNGSTKLRVDASIGLAEHLRDESMKGLLERADAGMYRDKAAFKARAAAASNHKLSNATGSRRKQGLNAEVKPRPEIRSDSTPIGLTHSGTVLLSCAVPGLASSFFLHSHS